MEYAEGRSKHMTYDSTNRIRTVKDEGTGDTVGTYYYDDGGFRVRRISKREVDRKTYEHEILYTSMYMGLEIQKDTQGNVVTNSYAAVNNIYLNGLRIATIIPSGEVTYYLTDQVDSVKVVANEQGLPVSRTEFHPYGETWFQEGNDNFAPKYNSQELDKESGLYFYNARYYDAEVGRFVTADNVIDGEWDTQGWNRYSYVKGNPIRFGDPSGKDLTDQIYEGIRSMTPVSPTTGNQGDATITAPAPKYLNGAGHSGTDLAGNKNQKIYTPKRGVVTSLERGNDNNISLLKISNVDGTKNEFKHLKGRLDIEVGDKVYRGQVVGTLDNSGNKLVLKGKNEKGEDVEFKAWDGYHLHFRSTDANGDRVNEVKTLLNKQGKEVNGLKLNYGNRNIESYYKNNQPELYQDIEKSKKLWTEKQP